LNLTLVKNAEKEYFMKKKSVIVIGGALADITGIPNKTLIQGDSNPGNINISSGEVASLRSLYGQSLL